MKRLILVLSFLLVGLAGHAVAGTTTGGIVSQTLAAVGSCADYRVSGVCFWLKCPCGKSCCVKTSIRVTHFRPDVVISTYHDPKQHPWSDYGSLVATQSTSIAGGLLNLLLDSAGSRTQGNEPRDRSKLFRDGDAIGHPLTSGFLGYFCPAATTAFQPYFDSHIDAITWRSIVPIESLYPQALIPGLSEVGNFPINTWGSIYPRDGNLTQQHAVKNSAVLSLRIGHIATRDGQPHVYTKIPTGGIKQIGDYRTWLPTSPLDLDTKTGKWQMLSPSPETSCTAFGINDVASLTTWGDGKTDSAEGYAYNLWREYSCCQKVGTVFLYAITF